MSTAEGFRRLVWVLSALALYPGFFLGVNMAHRNWPIPPEVTYYSPSDPEWETLNKKHPPVNQKRFPLLDKLLEDIEIESPDFKARRHVKTAKFYHKENVLIKGCLGAIAAFLVVHATYRIISWIVVGFVKRP